jgi:hypothetical protein
MKKLKLYDVYAGDKTFRSTLSTVVFDDIRKALNIYEDKLVGCIEKPKLTEGDIFHAAIPDHMKDALLKISEYTGVPDRQEARFAIPVWMRKYDGWPAMPTFSSGDDMWTFHTAFPNAGAHQDIFYKRNRSLFGMSTKIRSFLLPQSLRMSHYMHFRCSVGDQLRAYAEEVNTIQYEMARVMCVFRVIAEHFSSPAQMLFHWPALQMVISDEANFLSYSQKVREAFTAKMVTTKSNVVPRTVMEAASETLTKAVMVAKFAKPEMPLDENYGRGFSAPIQWRIDESAYKNIWKHNAYTVNNT